MTLDPAITAANLASAERIRSLADRLTDEELLHPVGEHWTVSIMFAHLAFWEGRVRETIERSERAGHLVLVDLDLVVNDLSLPLWAAIPPRVAGRLAFEAATGVNARLEAAEPWLVVAVEAANPRWIRRSLHRTQHLDEAEAALAG
jgi:hypothetical protein